MHLGHVLSIGSVMAAVILCVGNMPSAAFVALLVGTAAELLGAAVAGKQNHI